MTEDTDDLRDRVAQLERRVAGLESTVGTSDTEPTADAASDSAWTLEVVRDLCARGDSDSAAIQDVLVIAAEDGVEDPQSELAELKRIGEVYSPDAGRVKVT